MAWGFTSRWSRLVDPWQEKVRPWPSLRSEPVNQIKDNRAGCQLVLWDLIIEDVSQRRNQLTHRPSTIFWFTNGKINTKSSYKRHRQGIKFSMDTCSDIEHELIPWHLLYSISFVFPLVVVFPFLWWITCLFFFLWEHSRVVGVANQKTTSWPKERRNKRQVIPSPKKRNGNKKWTISN